MKVVVFADSGTYAPISVARIVEIADDDTFADLSDSERRTIALEQGEPIQPKEDEITLDPFGEASAFVLVNGKNIGEISGTKETGFLALPAAARHGSYRFATREDAVAACVSYVKRGYWTAEIS